MAAHTSTAEPALEQFGYQQELRRLLGWKDLTTYGLIFMVVTAPFGIFGSVFQASAGMVALAYLIGMIAMMFTASSYGVMVRAYPIAGSVFTYAGRAIAPSAGFLTGWALMLDYVLVPGLLSLIAAASMTSIVPAVPVWAWIAIFVIGNAALNVFGIKTTKLMNRAFLIGELIVLGVYLVMGVAALAAGKGRGFSFAPVFDANALTLSVAFGAVAVAALSFLGFDALAMLTEEAKGGARQVSKAMYAALGVTGLLFITQTWVAALLVPDPARLIAEGDPTGTAFYDTARVAGGPWLATLTALATALAWGLANNMVAQVATSRLLYAMARDRQLPGFLARVSVKRSVPVNAVLLTAAVSLILGLYMSSREDGITLLASLVSFGALSSFLVLHLATVIRWWRTGRVGSVWRNLLIPITGMIILGVVMYHANVLAQTACLYWMGLGLVVLGLLRVTGRKPNLSGFETTADTTADGGVEPVGAGRHV